MTRIVTWGEMFVNPYKTVFITLEGVDGSGKSTQAYILDQNLHRLGHEVFLIYEPYENMSFKVHPETRIERQTLFIEDSVKHIAEFIISGLKNGIDAISNRYLDSIFAYWLSEGGKLKDILDLHKKEMSSNLIMPDVTFFLDTDVDVAYYRIMKLRRFARSEHLVEIKEKLKKSAEGYHQLYSSGIFDKTGRRVEFIKDDGKRSKKEIAKEILKKAIPFLKK